MVKYETFNPGTEPISAGRSPRKWEVSETQWESQSPNVATSRDAQRRSVLVLLAMENETTSDGSMEFNPAQL